jgi:ATP-dependent Clp protease adapter protein ClpS
MPMNSETVDLSKKRYLVSIYEIQEHVFAEEFSGQYVKTVTLSDGTARTLQLTPMMRNGTPVIEFNDTGGRSYMGIMRVRTGMQTHGNLMVQIFDPDDRPPSPVLPSDTSLISIPDFVPPGFIQGIEILNDDITPMEFVVGILRSYLGLSHEDATQMMLAIHTRGGAMLPTPSLAEAERIAAQLTAEAKRHSYPLVCRPIGQDPGGGPRKERGASGPGAPGGADRGP